MNERTGKIIIALLVIMTMTMVGSMVMNSRAQDPTLQKGFWFWKRPEVSQASKDWDIIAAENYLNRLSQLGTWVLDEPGILDVTGNYIVWTQGHIDEVQAEIVRVTQIIADLPR